MTKHRHDPITCPSCECATLEHSARLGGVGTGGPGPGDYTVCAECGEFLRFGEGLRLEKAEIPADMAEDDRRKVLASQALFRAKRERRRS